MILGFLNIDKPAGMTSHDVVAKVRRGLKITKVGHAGTLDPLATGVLVICVGAATRLSEYVMHTTKAYRAVIHLGQTTTTYDAEGEIVSQADISSLTRADIERALARFHGDIEQVPPMYSAIKQGGRKLYDLARAGQVVERPSRAVEISSLDIAAWTPPQVTVEVVCSAGTYIRSLAHDLGAALGVGAFLAGLVRTASGSFRLEDSVGLDALLAAEDWPGHLIPPSRALTHLPVIECSSAAVDDLAHGRSMPDPAAKAGVIAQAYDPAGQFIAIVEGDGQCWRPRKVFA